MRSPVAMLAATAATALVLTPSAGLAAPGAGATSRAPVKATSRLANRRGGSPGCDLVTPEEIKAVLGVTVGKPTVGGSASVTMCTYSGDKVLLVRIETGMTSASFSGARQNFDAEGEPTTTYTGLGLPAYTSVLAFNKSSLNTLAVLKGGTELLVTGVFPVAKLAALVKKVLPAM